MENDSCEFQAKNDSGEHQIAPMVGLTENKIENYSSWLLTENNSGVHEAWCALDAE